MGEQLIFVTDEAPRLPSLASGATFCGVRGPLPSVPMLGLLVRRYGPAGAAKAVAKVLTPARRYYAVVENAAIASDGWILIGRCQAYPIPPNSCVIGPIWTDPPQRGRGLASAALSRAVEWCLAAGLASVYIDTSVDNVASQGAIRASGFKRAPAS